MRVGIELEQPDPQEEEDEVEDTVEDILLPDDLEEEVDFGQLVVENDIVNGIFPDLTDSFNIRFTIEKVPSIPKFYRWHLKNQTLQHEIKNQQKLAGLPEKEIMLPRDTKTRWDSLCPMILAQTNVSKLKSGLLFSQSIYAYIFYKIMAVCPSTCSSKPS